MASHESDRSKPAPSPRLQATHSDGRRFTIAGRWRLDPAFRAVLNRADSQADDLGWNRLATRGFVIDYAHLYFRDETILYDQRARRAILMAGTVADAEVWKRFMELSRAVRGHESWGPPMTVEEQALWTYCENVGRERLDRLRAIALGVIIENPHDDIQRRILARSTQTAVFHLWNLLASGKAPQVLEYFENRGLGPFRTPLQAIDDLGQALREGVVELLRTRRLEFRDRWPFDEEFRRWMLPSIG